MNSVFGTRLRKLRKNSGMTQSQLAGILSKSTSAVRMWELSSNEPDMSTLVKLSCIFDCSLDYLLCRDMVIGSQGAVRTNIPVYTLGNYGVDVVSDEYRRISPEYTDDGNAYIMIRITENDMADIMPVGCVVTVRRQDSCMNGQIALINLCGKFLFRKIIFCDGGILLQPGSALSDAQFVDSAVGSTVFEIIGIAVEYTCSL